MGRGLDGYFSSSVPEVAVCAVFRWLPVRAVSRTFAVAIARGKHLFPFRTEQLSLSAPMVLGPQGPGRVGRRRFNVESPPLAGSLRLWRGHLPAPAGTAEPRPCWPLCRLGTANGACSDAHGAR
jgi:hypothetical protein